MVLLELVYLSKSNLITPPRRPRNILDPLNRTTISPILHNRRKKLALRRYLYPLFSMTLRYRTSNPLEVNMTILNSIPMGGRDQAFLCVSLDNVASP